VDVRHRQGERDALIRCLDQGADVDSLAQALGDGLDAYWKLLDGICDETGIDASC
jgi:hypothetical protein